MKANYKTIDRLSPSDREKVEAACQAKIDHEEAELQKIWLQMACAVLHDVFGFGESRCLAYLLAFKRMYQKNSRLKTKEAQTEWLTAKTDFMQFPKDFVDKMEEL